MIDIHTHLNFDAFSDLDACLERMKNAGVSNAVVVGTDAATSKKAIELAHEHANLYATVGLHPTDIAGFSSSNMQEYLDLASDNKVVAIGEIGLDYYHSEKSDEAAGEKAQLEVLVHFIDLANQQDLPAIFHARNSENELLAFLRSHPVKRQSVLHCFSGDAEVAKKALDQGLIISFTNMLGFSKNEALREVAKNLPHHRVTIETDCPFLPPQAKRGQRCEPADVVEVTKVLAELWGKPLQYVDEITSTTSKSLFSLE